MTSPARLRLSEQDRAFYVSAGTFCLLSALRDVGAQLYFVRLRVPLEILLLIGFAATTIFGVGAARRSSKPSGLMQSRAFGLLLLLNVLTAISWVAVLAGLRGLLASSLTALLLGTIPLATLAIQGASSRKVPARHDVIGGVVVALGATLIVFFEGKMNAEQAPWATCVSVAGGVAAAATNVTAGKLTKDGFTAYQLMGARFALTLLVALACLLFYRQGDVPSTGPMWFLVAAFALFGFCAPMIAIQKAIESGGDHGIRTLGFMVACIPILVVAFQSAIGVHSARGREGAVVGAVVISMGCILTAWLRRRNSTS